MVDPVTSRRFGYRCLFVGLCMVVIFFKMLPLSTIPGRLPGPDLLFCLTAVWIMRRPKWAPVGLIVLMHLVADILFLRPIGLWSAISLLGYEYMRSQAEGGTEISPPLEIGLAAATFAVMAGLNGLVQYVLGLPQPSFGVTGLHVIMTVVAYPFVIAVSVYLLRVRRARPTDLDGTGFAI